MKKNLFLTMTMLCFLPSVICHPSSASAQRIRDLSLSPEETMRQSGQPGVQPAQGFPGIGGTNNRSPGSDAIQERIRAAQAPKAMRYMDAYCHTNSQPGDTNACLQRAQQQYCDQFRGLPPKAQQAIDDSITCMDQLVANGGGAADVCAVYDSRRMDMLKEHWQDKPVAEAIVFLPEIILASAHNCMAGGR